MSSFLINVLLGVPFLRISKYQFELELVSEPIKKPVKISWSNNSKEKGSFEFWSIDSKASRRAKSLRGVRHSKSKVSTSPALGNDRAGKPVHRAVNTS